MLSWTVLRRCARLMAPRGNRRADEEKTGTSSAYSKPVSWHERSSAVFTTEVHLPELGLIGWDPRRLGSGSRPPAFRQAQRRATQKLRMDAGGRWRADHNPARGHAVRSPPKKRRLIWTYFTPGSPLAPSRRPDLPSLSP